ncbi:hypothetical protein [Deinococcus sp.]|nr:hypothetical protein [Deinococcus sp.]
MIRRLTRGPAPGVVHGDSVGLGRGVQQPRTCRNETILPMW